MAGIGIPTYSWANNGYVPGSMGAPFVDPIHGTVKVQQNTWDVNPGTQLALYLSNKKLEDDGTVQAEAANQAITQGWKTQLEGNSTRRQKASMAGGSNAAGSDWMTIAKGLIDQLQGKTNEANAANESRYQTTLHDLEKAKAESLGIAQGLGKQQAKDIATGAANQKAAYNGNLISRGLGNSTVGVALDARANEDMHDEMGRLNEVLGNQRTGIIGNYAQARAGIQSMRNDIGPNMTDYLELFKQLAGA